MSTKLLVAAVVLALPAGWFVSVLFDRIPDNLPLFKPAEPVRLKGKYLVMYLVTIVTFVGALWRFHDSSRLVLASYLALFTVLVALSSIDLVTYRLPDRIVVPFLIASIPVIMVASVLEKDPAQIRYALLGGGVYFGFLLIFHLAFPRGMGFGDVKLAAVMGMYVGWCAVSYTSALAIVLYSMIFGFVTGFLIGIVVFAFRRKSQPVPFGPALAFGAVLAIVFSAQILPPGTV